MTTKSPTGRFGIFFGLKRRPSSNFQSNNDSTFYNGGPEEDPFAANVPLPMDVSTSSNLPQAASELGQGLGINIVYPHELRDPPTTDDRSFSARRPIPIDVFRLPRVDPPVPKQDDLPRLSRKVGNSTIDKVPLTLAHGDSTTSAESLALAAAIAHANGMVLSPDPASSAATHRKSAATDEYPSPPPSNHSSPYPSGVPSNANGSLEETEEEGEENTTFLVIGSAGNSSLPTTPALIDSFPATPHGPMQPHVQEPHPRSSPSRSVLPSESVSFRTSSRGARQRAGSTPAVWSSNAPLYNAANLDAWDEAEVDHKSHNHAHSRRATPPVPGPPPSAPLPPEPLSPRLPSSGLYKHLHQLELDITSLTRKLTTASSRPGSSHQGSSNPSTSDVPKMLKKAASQSRLQRESSSGTAGSSGGSNFQGASASASTTALSISTSPSKIEAALQNAKRARVLQTLPPMPSRSNLDRRPSTAPAESSLVSPLKLRDKEKEKERKSSKEKEHPVKEERDKDGFSRRRFFSKYASMGSHVEKEASAEIPTADLEDVRSIASMHSGGTGLPDEEWAANFSLAISSSLKTQESSINILPVSSPSSQKSPVDESPLVSSPPSRSRTSPSEYVPQHILPPADLLRLERTGFAIEELRNKGDAKLANTSPISPLSTSPHGTHADWERRSLGASKAGGSPHPPGMKTRMQRSGSLAVTPSTGSSQSPSSTPSHLHNSSVTSRIVSGGPPPPPRKMSSGSIHPPSGKRSISGRSITSPSSPAGAPLSLPPPPRPRVKSLRSSGDLEYASEVASLASNASSGLPPPPRNSRRPSTASNASSTRTIAEKHQSILRRPSFLDIMDDEGRTSLEEASETTARGLAFTENHLTEHLIAPVSRSRSGTVSSGWTASTVSISRPTSRPASRQHTPITSRQPTPTIRDTTAPEDSFLDMGKVSLDTIRSEDEDISSHYGDPITISVPNARHRPWHDLHSNRPPIGSTF